MQYDVFVSSAPADLAWVRPLVAALRGRGLRVFFDEPAIEDVARITERISGDMAQSKTLLAWYSGSYSRRWAASGS